MAPDTAGLPHVPHYRPLAGNDDLTCVTCHESWPCTEERKRQHLREHLTVLVEAITPLMDRDYCSPFTSAWELDPHVMRYDGEVIYEQVRVAWEQAKGALDAT